MKWLTIDYIKQHSRLCCDCEDELLDLYGNAAEDTVLELCDRSWANMITTYGDIPNAIRQASLMLVEASYTQRSPVSVQNMYAVAYGFDMLVKPYMRLTNDDETIDEVPIGSNVKLVFSADLPNDLTLSDVNFTAKVWTAGKSVTYTKGNCIATDDPNAYLALVDSTTLGVGEYLITLTVQIPDTDYTSGYRQEIIKINPHVKVTR